LKNYKILGKKAFEEGEIAKAKTFFALAKKPSNSDEIDFLIELCEFAKIDSYNAFLIYEYYLASKKSKSLFSELYDTIDAITNDRMDFGYEENANYDDILAVSYQNNDFKKNYENLIFSTKICINSRKDFLNLIEKIVENGMDEIAFAYLEQAISHFKYDEKFQKITEKLKKNEN